VNGSKHLLQIYIAIEAPHYKASQPSSFDAVECVLLVFWFLRPYEGLVNLQKNPEVIFAAVCTLRRLALR